MNAEDLLRQLVALLAEAVASRGLEVRIVVGPAAVAPTAHVVTVPPAEWASGPTIKRAADFSRVYWPGVGDFHLTPKQALVVQELWRRTIEGTEPHVCQRDLLIAADTEATRLSDLFRRSHVWGRLVLSVGRGQYQLPPLPSEGDRC